MIGQVQLLVHYMKTKICLVCLSIQFLVCSHVCIIHHSEQDLLERKATEFILTSPHTQLSIDTNVQKTQVYSKMPSTLKPFCHAGSGTWLLNLRSKVWIHTCDFQVYHVIFSEFQAFKFDFRSMTMHSIKVNPNLSLHNTKVALSLLHHIISTSKPLWVHSKG